MTLASAPSGPILVPSVLTMEDWINTHPAAHPAATGNGWADQSIPKRGWTCVHVEDLGADGPDYMPDDCQMCGNNNLRFLHYMEHPDYPGQLVVGCICAGHMAEGYDGAARERELTNLAIRRSRWLCRRWRTSAKGNHYLNVRGRNVGVFLSRRGWVWWVGRTFSRRHYATSDKAKLALFDELALWG